jgi:radical SAM/Cys-rich protein
MDKSEQQELLKRIDRTDPFAERLKSCSAYPLHASSIETLQINITRRCNISCLHCHVKSSPQRGEEMSKKDLESCLKAALHPDVKTLDITGGSPEMHPHIEWFVREAAKIGKRLIVRSNAAILMEEEYSRFFDIYAETKAEIVVSLPNLNRERTDRMRGSGVFDKVIAALQKLNGMGYGRPNTGLILNLVHNPAGAFLPVPQQVLENDYKTRLRRDHGVEFNSLYCLTNAPVGRFLDFLESSGNLEQYMCVLKDAFNPAAIDNLMCRTTLSVSYDGRLFDCDFNQALDLPVKIDSHPHISNFDFEELGRRRITVCSHCYTCTAGAGSSCQGTIAE